MTSIQRSVINSKQNMLLKHKINRLEKALEKMYLTDTAKNKFLANITHELRTPLNTIIGFSQILYRDTELTPQQTEYMSLIMQSSEHLLSLIDDILQFSKIESGNITLNQTEFDLYNLLEGLDSIYYAKASEKDLVFDLQIAENTPRYLLADENKIRQILMNLLSNSMKFTERGSIQLAVKCLENINDEKCILQIRVSDTGTGIKEDEINRLFQPYQQTASGEQSNTGSGLGLVITREFVQMMGGEIDVCSEWKKGTIFNLTIQANITKVEDCDNKEDTLKVIKIAPNQPTQHVLVVDDKPENRRLLHDLLSKVGFEVQAVANGLEAIEKLKTWQPNLVFMDMRMPKMNGYETTKAIRKMPSAETIVIIALTASTSKHETDSIFQVGCNDLVFKPFREVDLFRKLQEHLNIDFIYSENTNSITTLSEPLATTIDIMSLSPNLRNRLYTAAANYSFDQVQSVIMDFPAEQQILGNILRKKVSEFDFVGILNLFNQKESA